MSEAMAEVELNEVGYYNQNQTTNKFKTSKEYGNLKLNQMSHKR